MGYSATCAGRGWRDPFWALRCDDGFIAWRVGLLAVLLDRRKKARARQADWARSINQSLGNIYCVIRLTWPREPVSTAFVESTINEVIARRMTKKQQMQWSRKGAHYLLQTQTAALNNELQDKFVFWYPGFQSDGKVPAMAA